MGFTWYKTHEYAGPTVYLLKKKSAYKWTHTVQKYIVQGLTAAVFFFLRNKNQQILDKIKKKIQIKIRNENLTTKAIEIKMISSKLN